MNQSALVSIIIPVYNRENLIAETIKSAMSQTYHNIEVIIVDNCSTDNTYKIVQKYANCDSRIKVFQNRENIGPVKNWKACLDKAKGEYCKILWSDDLIEKDFLELCLPVLKNNSDIGFVYTPTIIHTKDNLNLLYARGRGKKHKLKNFVLSFLYGWLGQPVSPGNALFRMEDVKNNLIVDIPNDLELDFNKYGAGNDLLIYLCCYPKYKYFFIIDKTLSHFVSHADSFTASNDLSLYYLTAILYYTREYLDRELLLKFYHGLKVINLLKNNKFEELSCRSIRYNFFLIVIIIIGKLYAFIYQAYIWKFKNKDT